jgi:hypothetical protein
MQHRQEAGGLYVQRGDYNIVSREGSIISPTEFAETVKAGMQVEMSIIKRTLHAWRKRRAQISGTSPLKTDEAAEWFIWYAIAGIGYPLSLKGVVSSANPKCRRKYEINEHNGEIVSPEVAYVHSSGICLCLLMNIDALPDRIDLRKKAFNQRSFGWFRIILYR